MNEHQITRVSVVFSILSVVAIYLLSISVPVKDISVCQLDYSMKGSSVKVSGTVTETYVNEGNVFFTLSDRGCETRIVLWSNMADEESSGISDGNNVMVTGMVDSYRGELEIIAKDVKNN